MTLRKPILFFLAALLTLPALVPAQDTLDSEEKKTLYALGLAMAQNLGSFQLSAEDLKTVQQGIVDGVGGGETKVSLEEYGPKIQAFAQARAAKAASATKEKGAGFLAKAATEEGAVKTASGLIITELKAGTGANPTADDKVTVHYHGTFPDGKVFDSSVDRGEPSSFPLSGVIRCWTEGVAMIKVGGKSRLICPSDIAYGDGGRGGIPPGATLIFEVELLSIDGDDS
jgi:FKBP-type peptidyl-prolyl cis-trans isomerase FkpA